ncbi:MAG: HDOD domain-containing protein [Proteobacteria bacterium]|nr:HDOD domain-containing protein [Pseudomonadota bacterium]
MTQAAAPLSPDALQREAELAMRDLGIPPCPDILMRFDAEMRSSDPDLRKLAGLINGDVALSAAMLKTVNSPFYGLSTKAGNVQQALSVLGLRAGANLVTGLMLRQAFPAGAGPAMQRFWDRSGEIAQVAAAIAARVRHMNPDTAHTYALFRDCGMAVMIARFPAYAAFLDRLEREPGKVVIVAEDARFRFHHARVGYALARGWLLPEPMSKAILYHHDLDLVIGAHRDVEPGDRRLVAFGLLAEQVLALRAGKGLCPDWAASEDFVLDILGLTADDVVELVSGEVLEDA